MSAAPKVCVALSVRDGERYLPQAIESVLAQEGVELELRLYDNGSRDRSVAIARGYESDLRVSVSENPYGTEYWDSLNRALAETEAPYYAAFACDDLMLPGNLAAKVELLEATGAAFAHSISQVIDADGAVQRLWCDYASVPELVAAPDFVPHMAPVNTTVLMAAVCDSAALCAVGGFDRRLIYCADWLALLRLALRGPVATIHRPLICYRRHAEAGSSADFGGASFVGALVSGLAEAIADPAFPAQWRDGAAAKLFAGCLNHCARELAGAQVQRTDATGTTGYSCAAWASELLPQAPALREGLRAQLGAAGFSVPLPFPLLGRAPASPLEATRLLERAASLAAAGLADGLTVACRPQELGRVRALLEEGCAGAPALEVTLVPSPDPTLLLEPGRVLVCPAADEGLVAEAEAFGLPVLAFDLPGPLAEPWDGLIAALVAAPTPPAAAAAAAGGRLPAPSAPLLAFTAQFPWERGTILSFVQRSAAALAPGTRVLDVGAGDSPYRELFAHVEYRTTDWENSVHPGARRVDYVGSADDLPIPDRCFDAVVNTQVLEHVADPAAVLAEMRRVLVPGGRLFLTVPLTWELHEEPYDFWRYTRHGLAHLLAQAGFVEVEIEARNDCFTTIAQMLRNVDAIIGSRADGRDGERRAAGRQMRELADVVAAHAPLDARWIFPLGYQVTAARPGGGAGRGELGLGAARSAVVLALGDEVAERPELLRDYAAALAADADVTLALLDAERSPAGLLAAAGLDRAGAEVVALPAGAATPERLAPLAHGLLSLREPPAALATLPSLRGRSAAELLTAALARTR